MADFSKLSRQTLAIYWRHAAKYPWRVALTLISQTAISVVAVVIPLYFKRFFDLIGGRSVPTPEIVTALFALLWIMLLWQMSRWVINLVFRISLNKLSLDATVDLSQTVFTGVHRHSFDFFNNMFVGSLVKRSQFFIGTFERMLWTVVFELLPLIVSSVLIIVILWRNNFWLGAGILIWLIIFLIVNFVFSRAKAPVDARRSESSSRISGLLADTITNHATVKLFNGWWREKEKIYRAAEEHRQWKWKARMLQLNFDAVQGVLAVGLEIGILVFAVKLWQAGALSIGSFFLVHAYLVSIFNHVWGFGNVIRDMYENLIEANELTAILQQPIDVRDRRGAQPLVVTKGKIEFRNVMFRYPQSTPVINKLSLTIEPAERVALIGPSGAGKSTVVKLLLRMYDVSKGQILVDNKNIAHVTRDSLWSQISFVPQEPILFHRSLLENIRYGRPGATDAEVVAAAQAARCHDFISQLADGYNTFVGERGVKLSGGERQRVAIARAILRNAPILILDEATSSLDSESERLIQSALEVLMAGKTVIAIAHRLSTIRKMNRIVVVDNGQVVESGTHQQLTSRPDGLYQRLWQLQVEGFIK